MSVIALVLSGVVVNALNNWSGPEPPSDEPLRAKISRIRSNFGGWSVAFTSDREASAREFASRADREGVADNSNLYEQFLNDELNAGAYLLGGMTIRIELENLDDGELIVTDVRPVEQKKEPVPLEAAIILPTQGAGEGCEPNEFCLG